ncbi:GumC family protein [Qipengyuania flava]|uniref:GumC family protein n=1 Tax=Qipengyuania flava TaxID=192812 RepID=UPI0018DFB397|nr:polysaccharide biosynthesis tyrosine autokinase [Qipengyuania flava]
MNELAVPAAERVGQTIRNNKFLIAGIVSLAVLAGIIATLLMTPKYQASARIEISRVEANVTAVEGVETEDQVLDAQYYETQYELLKSRSLAQQVVREADLVSNEQFLAAFKIDDLPTNPEKELAELLLEHVSIAPVGTSNLVDIRFKSSDPVLSAKIANIWAQEYIASNLARRFGATTEARQFLEERLGQLRERLEDAERELITYAAERDLFALETSDDSDSEDTASQTLVARDLQALNTALAQATTERIAAQSALEATATALAPEDAAALQPLRQERAELAAERARLRATAGEQYPAVLALSEQIEQLDREIALARTQSGSAVRARYEQAAATENRLRARVNELQQEFVGQRRDSVQYNILQREVDTNRSLYNALLQRYREIGVAGVGENNIAIVDVAEVPRKPVGPNLLRNLLLSLLLGGAAAGGIILLREKLDQSIRDPAQVSEILDIPLLGSVPRVQGEDVVEALASRNSELYEAYFNLFTNLGFLSKDGVPKILMVGSTRPAEGKSLSSVALAKILAERGKRVLLLDADMRHSGLSKYLEIPAGRGLSNYLRGEDQWPEMVVSGAPFAFEVFPSGRQPPNAAELLAGNRFSILLETLGASYDHVVIDAPPVLGLADAPIIAAAADGVIMIMEANVGKKRMIAQALDRLEQGGGKVFGGVVTKLDQRNASYGYGYGYGYGYSYGKKDIEEAA